MHTFEDEESGVQRAPILEDFRDFMRIIRYVRNDTDHGARDEVGVRLSFQAGLRAREIALLEWKRHVLTPSGDIATEITITKDIGKKCVARLIPLDNPDIRRALARLRKERPNDKYVFYPIGLNAEGNHLAPNSVVQWFKRLYAATGFDACSSHSGRRTFITKLSRVASEHDCSIKDVMKIAGHKRMQTTAGYIEPSRGNRAMVASAINGRKESDKKAQERVAASPSVRKAVRAAAAQA